MNTAQTHVQPTIPPQDGTRFLLHYHTRHYQAGADAYVRTGDKWEEVRWVKTGGGSPGHYEPWCGNHHTSSSHHISPRDTIEWMPLPIVPA